MTFLSEVKQILRFKDPNCVKAIIILRRAKRRGLKEITYETLSNKSST